MKPLKVGVIGSSYGFALACASIASALNTTDEVIHINIGSKEYNPEDFNVIIDTEKESTIPKPMRDFNFSDWESTKAVIDDDYDYYPKKVRGKHKGRNNGAFGKSKKKAN